MLFSTLTLDPAFHLSPLYPANNNLANYFLLCSSPNICIYHFHILNI